MAGKITTFIKQLSIAMSIVLGGFSLTILLIFIGSLSEISFFISWIVIIILIVFLCLRYYKIAIKRKNFSISTLKKTFSNKKKFKRIGDSIAEGVEDLVGGIFSSIGTLIMWAIFIIGFALALFVVVKAIKVIWYM